MLGKIRLPRLAWLFLVVVVLIDIVAVACSPAFALAGEAESFVFASVDGLGPVEDNPSVGDGRMADEGVDSESGSDATSVGAVDNGWGDVAFPLTGERGLGALAALSFAVSGMGALLWRVKGL